MHRVVSSGNLMRFDDLSWVSLYHSNPKMEAIAAELL